MNTDLLKTLKQFFLVAFIVLPGSKSVMAQAQPVKPDTAKNYQLIWHDEFDGTTLNPLLWNFETGNLGVNNEKQFYQTENTNVHDGFLTITAKKESVQGQRYTSSRLNTKGKFGIARGRIEASIKCPMGKGLWPAFWMLGSNIDEVGWPKCGEIDILEHVNADSIIYGTIHWDNKGHAMYGVKALTNAADFHLYAVEWDNNEIRWYIDSNCIGSANIKNGINNTSSFQKPFYILLNFAVGGDFPGNDTPIDQSKFPAKMVVDYVRVYELVAHNPVSG